MDNLLKKIEEISKNKEVIVFDLDGTLAESKSEVDREMIQLLGQLLKKRRAVVIGGGKFDLFRLQLLSKLDLPRELLEKLFLFPATGTRFYKYIGGDWQIIYSQDLSKDEKNKIFSAFDKSFKEINYKHPKEVYGEIIEDRGTEIVFSALGQNAPLELKEKWKDENPEIRKKLAEVLQRYLPDMEIKVTGLTSIDVTRKGIDKGYGIQQIKNYLDTTLENMIFIGDAFSIGENDEAALKTGVACFEVSGVEDTKNIIKYLVE